MNDRYRKITVQKPHCFVMAWLFFYESNRICFRCPPVHECLAGKRKKITTSPHYGNCKMFGEMKSAKMATCLDLQFWCLKELLKRSPMLCALRSFCSELYSNFTGASRLQRSSGPLSSVCSTIFCLNCKLYRVSESGPALLIT